RAEAELARARADAISAARGLELAELELARLVGAPASGARTARLAAPCRVRAPYRLDRDSLVAEAQTADPAVAEARFQTAAAAAAAEEARARRWPDIAVAARHIEYGSDKGH